MTHARWGLAFAVTFVTGCGGKGLDAFSNGTLLVSDDEGDIVKLWFESPGDCTKIAARVRVTANGVPMQRTNTGCELQTMKSGIGRSAGPSFELHDPKVAHGGKTTFALADGAHTVTFEAFLFDPKNALELVSPKLLEGVANDEPIRFRMKPTGRWRADSPCHAQVFPPEGRYDLLNRSLTCKLVSPTELEVRAVAGDALGVDTSKLPGCKLEVSGHIDTATRCEGVKTCQANSHFSVAVPARFQ